MNYSFFKIFLYLIFFKKKTFTLIFHSQIFRDYNLSLTLRLREILMLTLALESETRALGIKVQIKIAANPYD
jgi:hypothetical protein